MILSRYEEIETNLHLSGNLTKEMKEYFASLDKNTSTGEIVSRGEYFCAKLMAEYLGFHFVDAAELLFFTFDGKIDYEKSRTATRKMFEQYNRLVVPGFYGVYPNNDVHVFSRGGSDITGSYLAAFLGAEVYENWTDVSGIYAVDPRNSKESKIIQTISYDELRELSCMGANVLHQDSITPCQDAEIPIHILNTNAPEDKGTYIIAKAKSDKPLIGLAGKKGFVSFSVHKRRMSSEMGFIYRALEIFTKYNINIEHVPTGMDNISFIVEEDSVRSMMHKIVAELEEDLDCEVQLERNIALIAIVGEQMKGDITSCSAVLDILKENAIEINSVIKAPDDVTMIVGVGADKLDLALGKIYEGLLHRGLI